MTGMPSCRRRLNGKNISRRYGDTLIKLRIVETEAYIGAIDKASHGYGGKVTPGPRLCTDLGFAYVYFIYGMYYCLNFVTEKEGTCSAVLIRAGDPYLTKKKCLLTDTISP